MWEFICELAGIRLLYSTRAKGYYVSVRRDLYALPAGDETEARRELDQWRRWARGTEDRMPQYAGAML